MSKSFANLRNQFASSTQLKDKFASLKSGNTRTEDETFYTLKHVRGEDGNGRVIMRFLPQAPDGNGGLEPDAFVRLYRYSFKGKNGQWYINESPMTIGLPDPCYEYNGTVFGDESLTDNQKKAKLIRRATEYIANVLIIEDKMRPENNGKVFKFKYGPMIHEIIEKAMFPEFEADAPIEVFNPFTGANFDLRVITKTITGSDGKPVKVPSYEKSVFMAPSSIVENPDDFEAIWKQQYKLAPLVDPSVFKSYEKLEEEFNRAMYGTKGGKNAETRTNIMGDEYEVEKEKEPAKGKTSTAKALDDELPWDLSKEDSEDEVDGDADTPSASSDGKPDLASWFAKVQN